MSVPGTTLAEQLAPKEAARRLTAIQRATAQLRIVSEPLGQVEVALEFSVTHLFLRQIGAAAPAASTPPPGEARGGLR